MSAREVDLEDGVPTGSDKGGNEDVPVPAIADDGAGELVVFR